MNERQLTVVEDIWSFYVWGAFFEV